MFRQKKKVYNDTKLIDQFWQYKYLKNSHFSLL